MPAEYYELSHVVISIFVYRQKNEGQSNDVLQSMQDYLRSLPFDFHNASIISGQEEGLYGWITVNYLMGNFLEVRLRGSIQFTYVKTIMFFKHFPHNIFG